MANLTEQLNQLNDDLMKKFPKELVETVQKELTGLIENKIATGLPVGTKAPGFELPDANGNKVSLHELLGKAQLSFLFIEVNGAHIVI